MHQADRIHEAADGEGAAAPYGAPVGGVGRWEEQRTDEEERRKRVETLRPYQFIPATESDKRGLESTISLRPGSGAAEAEIGRNRLVSRGKRRLSGHPRGKR